MAPVGSRRHNALGNSSLSSLSTPLLLRLPLVLALISAPILPLPTVAMPIPSLSSPATEAADSGASGPRRPGTIAATKSVAKPANLSQQRGRAVPGLRDAASRRTLAEGGGSIEAARIQ